MNCTADREKCASCYGRTYRVRNERRKLMKALTKKERKYWSEVFIDAFAQSAITVFEIGKLDYKTVESARASYNAYIQKSRRERKVAVMVRKRRVFLIKL